MNLNKMNADFTQSNLQVSEMTDQVRESAVSRDKDDTFHKQVWRRRVVHIQIHVTARRSHLSQEALEATSCRRKSFRHVMKARKAK